MTVERAALISFHACPMASLGQGKSGGMNVYVRNLAAALGERGVEVDVFTREHREAPDAEDAIEPIGPNARVVHLPGGGIDLPLNRLYEELPFFLGEIEQFRTRNGIDYQVVHSHYWLSGWLGRHLAEELGIAHVVTFHTAALIKTQSRMGEEEPEVRGAVEKELAASANRIIGFSHHERDALVRLYGAEAARITLAPCGVDLDRFRPVDREEARRRVGLNGEKVVLFVGRLEPLKGVDLLLHATAQMNSEEALRVLVVGGAEEGNNEMDRLKGLARELNVEKSVDFAGRVDQPELPFYYSAADVYVLPSYYESFGLSALEAMACGTPVVAARVGGLSSLVHHGHTGYLEPWRCPESFANSLEMILSSRDLREGMGRAARRRAENMSWERVAAEVARVYETALTEHQ